MCLCHLFLYQRYHMRPATWVQCKTKMQNSGLKHYEEFQDALNQVHILLISTGPYEACPRPTQNKLRPGSAHEPVLEVPHSLPIFSVTQSSCKMTEGVWSMSSAEQNKTWRVAHKGNEVSHLSTASLKTNRRRKSTLLIQNT